MKKIFTLILGLSVLSLSMLAQGRGNQQLPNSPRNAKHIQPAPANKMLTNSRLKSTRYDEYDNGTWTKADSSYYTYTGTRGGDDFNEYGTDYDMGNGFIWDAGAWDKNWLREKTYDSNNRMTSFVNKFWDGSAWENYRRADLAYNSAGRLASIANQQWDGTMWQNTTKNEYTYDANGNLLVDITSDGDTTAWRPAARITRTYNASNKILSELHEIDASGWLEQKRYTWKYNINNTIDTMYYEGYTSGPNTWAFYNRTSFTYNASGKILTQNKERTVAGVWRNDSLYIYTYNAQGHRTSEEFQIYNGGPYEKESKIEYTLDNNGYANESMDYEWTGAAWVETRRDTFHHDANGNETYFAYFSGSIGNWREDLRRTTSYNAFNQILSDSTSWRSFGQLQLQDRNYYYYETYEDGSNGITTIPTLSSTVMPNPFTINVAIQINVAQAGKYTFEVYNLSGQLVHHEERNLSTGEQTIIWEGNHAPKGVYFYKINSQGGISSGKLVKQ
ncbi:hypothetical protein BH09BAC1_BH09BAC1_25840 [soil metagenome]